MAVTEFPVNHPMAQRLWSKRLMAEVFPQTWINRLIGDDKSAIFQRMMPKNKGPGDRVTFGLRARLNGAGVIGDLTLEGKEEKLSINTDSLIINQLRHAVNAGGKMSQERVPFTIRAECKDGLSDWWANRIDTSAFLHLAGSPVRYDEVQLAWVPAGLEYTGMNPVAQPDAAHMVLANSSAANEAALGASDTFNLGMIDRAVAKAKTSRPLIRPARLGGDEYYVVVIHPFQTAQLRADNSAGGWKDINMARLAGGDLRNNPLVTGALGVYNNCIIHESNHIPPASTAGGVILPNVRRAMLLGAQAGVIGFGSNTPDEPENSFSWVEQKEDYDNQLNVAAAGIIGLKKTRYSPSNATTGVVDTASGTDFAVITMSSYSPTVA